MDNNPTQQPVDTPTGVSFQKPEVIQHPSSPLLAIFSAIPTAVKVAMAVVTALFLFWGLTTVFRSPEPPAKTFLIAIDKSWYPLRLVGKEEQMTAFVEMLLQTIARQQNLRLRTVYDSSSRIVADLENGKFDGIVSTRPIDFFMAGKYLESDFIYRLGAVLVVKKDSAIQKLADLNGKFVGLVGNHNAAAKLEVFPAIMQSTYGNTAQALADLESGKVDGLVIEILQANIFLQSFYAGKFRIIATPLTNEGIRLVLRIDEGAERFVELLNQGLEEMRENGSYEALLRAWL